MFGRNKIKSEIKLFIPIWGWVLTSHSHSPSQKKRDGMEPWVKPFRSYIFSSTLRSTSFMRQLASGEKRKSMWNMKAKQGFQTFMIVSLCVLLFYFFRAEAWFPNDGRYSCLQTRDTKRRRLKPRKASWIINSLTSFMEMTAVSYAESNEHVKKTFK